MNFQLRSPTHLRILLLGSIQACQRLFCLVYTACTRVLRVAQPAPTQGSNTQVHTFLSRLLGVTDTDRWILCISRSCIKDFILEKWKGQSYKYPSCLFNCQNLIHLKLSNCSLKPPLTFKGFKNLRSLDLQHVTIIQDVFENLVLTVPCLRDWHWWTSLVSHVLMHLICNSLVGCIFYDVSFRNTFHLALVSIGLYVNINTDENDTGERSSRLKFFVNLPHVRRLSLSYFLRVMAYWTSLLSASMVVSYLCKTSLLVSWDVSIQCHHCVYFYHLGIYMQFYSLYGILQTPLSMLLCWSLGILKKLIQVL